MTLADAGGSGAWLRWAAASAAAPGSTGPGHARRLELHRRASRVDSMPTTTVNVRYLVLDVQASVDWYTRHLGFELLTNVAPAFADVRRDGLRLLLSGRTSSAGRPMPDGRQPAPGGWNRIQLVVPDLPAEVERLRAAGLRFRNDIVRGPGGAQILLEDPSGNLVELFQPAQPRR